MKRITYQQHDYGHLNEQQTRHWCEHIGHYHLMNNEEKILMQAFIFVN